MDPATRLGLSATRFRFRIFTGNSRNYQFDLGQYMRYWNRNYPIEFRFNDDTELFYSPTFTKARLIEGDVRNLVVINMDKVRHFDFVHDRVSYQSKKDQVVWRGPVQQPWRIEFLNNFMGLLDVMWEEQIRIQMEFINAIRG